MYCLWSGMEKPRNSDTIEDGLLLSSQFALFNPKNSVPKCVTDVALSLLQILSHKTLSCSK